MSPQCYPNYKTPHRHFQEWYRSVQWMWTQYRGKPKRRKDLSTIAIIDKHDLPLSVSTHVTNPHEVYLVRLSSGFDTINATLEKLHGTEPTPVIF